MANRSEVTCYRTKRFRTDWRRSAKNTKNMSKIAKLTTPRGDRRLTVTCCWDATPRPPPFMVLTNIDVSKDDFGTSSSSKCWLSSLNFGRSMLIFRPPSFIDWAKSLGSNDSKSSMDLLFDEPLMEAAKDLASDSWSSTGLNRSSRNWSTSDACDGTRTRLTCEAN